jgi:hypothetical protein
MTNEQGVIEAKKEIARYKNNYHASVNTYMDACKNNEANLESYWLKCQKAANEYFNCVDEFVGNSDLLGAHESALWVTGFAEDCVAVLSTLCTHFTFLRGTAEKLSLDYLDKIEPGKTAYSNIQRMIVEYLPKDTVFYIKNKLLENNLPVYGFEHTSVNFMEKTENWKLIYGLIFGVIALAGITIISLFVPNPSEWQMFIFRGVFAISLAAIAAIIPGFINVKSKFKTKNHYHSVVAGGAIAIFIIVWEVNPPALIHPSIERSKTNTQRS